MLVLQQLLDFGQGRHGGEGALAGHRQRADRGAEAKGVFDGGAIAAERGKTRAVPAPLAQPEQQAADERIAGRGGIAGLDPETGHLPGCLAGEPADRRGAIGHDEQLRLALEQPLAYPGLAIRAAAERSRQIVEFLLRQLHQVGVDQRLPQPRCRIHVGRPQRRTQVQIQADHRAGGTRA